LRDGTNGFERILPGADRMYPDTDLPPRRITDERLERIRATIPSDFWNRESAYRKQGVPGDLVQPLAVSPHAALFEELTREGVSAVVAATVIIRLIKALRRSGRATGALDGRALRAVLLAHASGRLAKEGIPAVLSDICVQGEFSASMLPTACTDGEVHGAVRAALQALAHTAVRRPDRKHAIVMGMVMPALRGRVDGAGVARIVEEAIR
jgi:glutamyl-tRNA(Gln) amidotransferase subunit E